MEEIKKVVEAYQKNYATLTIQQLMDCQDKLSTLYYNFAEDMQEAMLDYAKKYGEYKNKYAKNYLQNIVSKIEEKMTSKQAEELAKEQTIVEWSNQMFASSYIEKMKVEDRAINKILSSIQQRISVLKQEYDFTK